MNLTHVRLLVSDFGAEFRFYRDTLRLPVHSGAESGPYAEFQAGNTILALFSRTTMSSALDSYPVTKGSSVVLCLAVDDVDGAFASASGGGARVVSRPTDRVEWEVRTAHSLDPEGNLIELNHNLRH